MSCSTGSNRGWQTHTSTYSRRKFDLNLVISDHDGDLLRRLDPGIACMTIPAGVDLGEFDPGTVDPDPNTVLWMGALSWPPNRDSFWWFYNQIVPLLVRRVPDVKIHIVGSSPPKEILAIEHPHVRIHGFVPDVSEALRRAAVCVVPLQIGSGIRMKLLEMFAMKKAVVCTSIGAEGLHLQHGKHLLLADTPDAFAEAVTRLLGDAQLRNALAANGYRHVQESYTWEKMGPLYEAAYHKAIQAHVPAKG